MRKWDLIKQSKLLKIKSKILTNLFNEKYGLKLGKFNNTTGTQRVKLAQVLIILFKSFFFFITSTKKINFEQRYKYKV